jgi:hypothetical protein
MLDSDLQARLVRRFADTAMRIASLPAARRAGVEAAPSFMADDATITCVCGITGSTYTEPWDGSSQSAEAFAEFAGEQTGSLVKPRKKNDHYAWLRATR